MVDDIGVVNLISLVWFLFCWVAYSLFAKRMAKKVASLSSVLHVHRINWMRRLLQREVRVGDAALLANLERNVTFFASSCVLILAGLLAALTALDKLQHILAEITFATPDSILSIELKMVTLIFVFIYAFFTFTWSMRQFGFASVLVGAAPLPDDDTVTANEKRSFAIYGAKIIDQASHSYNYGLRSFYFSLALLTWFISPWIFMVAAAAVVGVLYEREFLSNSLQAMKKVEGVGDKLFEDDKELYRRSLVKPVANKEREK
ncbi:DUF599 domain-containing protein [Bacterioplanoides sp.]|uniref:DUF599 domain-containing protein n=1 Tax=Bacterioplanoides sp. TaxID=2066072 RepID=UPI003B5C5A37